METRTKTQSVGRSISQLGRILQTQLWLWPLIAAVLLIGIGWWIRSAIERTLKDGMAADLQVILDADIAALDVWFRSQSNHAEIVAKDTQVVDLAEAVHDILTESNSPATVLESSELADLRKELEPWMASETESGKPQIGKYWGYVVVDSSFRVIASDRDEPMTMLGTAEQAEEFFGRDSTARQFIERILADENFVSRPFASSIMLPDENKEMKLGVPTMFACAPIENSTTDFKAALLLRIRPEEDFTHILETAQCGDTGETYAVGSDGLMLSQSRFDDEMKKIGLLVDRESIRSILNLEIRDPQVDMTRGYRPKLARADQPLTRMAADLVEGGSGVDVDGYRDYRGVPVIGAWKWLPKVEMGIATEIDLAEAYRPLYLLRWTFWGLFVLLAAAALVIFVYMLVTARMERKVRQAVIDARRLGQYALDEKIGEGGMGEVYKAHHDMLRRPTAVKLLNADRSTPTTVARFEREVQLTSQLNHPNTIAIYDFGRTPEGIFYYAMEFLDGITLDELIDREGPLSEGRVIHILRQVCGSLAEAHQIGLIHRDIKPANIMLNYRGGLADHVKVLDFGLVKAVDSERETKLTKTNTFTGTPQYLSPEGIEHTELVDGRSDLYAVGAVGYFLLTGTPPFDGESVMEVCMKQISTPPVPPSDRLGKPVSPDLQTVLLDCLAKNRVDRPATAQQLGDRLAACRSTTQWSRADALAWWTSRISGDKNPTSAMAAKTVTLDQTVVYNPDDGSNS